MPRRDQLLGNTNERLSEDAQRSLGRYVYVLVDPRSGAIFYVGKGGGSATNKGNARVLSHFEEARRYVQQRGSAEPPTAKLSKILEIWNRPADVIWWIVRYGIKSQPMCDEVEAALIDAFSVLPVKTLNAIRGRGAKSNGLLSSSDVGLLNPPIVSPRRAYPIVFLFPINRLFGKRADLYDATRHYWTVSERWRLDSKGAIALGINSMQSAAAFEIESWRKAAGKFAFSGEHLPDGHELARKSFAPVIQAALGYWQRGQYLIVELDGKGHFRVLRGMNDTSWFRLH